jgi:hypothetical protein
MFRRWPDLPKLIGVLALAASFAVVGCSKKSVSPEEAIEQQIALGVTALEKKDVAAAGDLVHETYRDSADRDKRRLKAIAFFYLRGNDARFAIQDEKVSVDPDGIGATWEANVVALRSKSAKKVVGDLVPDGRAAHIIIRLLREGDDWLITSIEGDGMGKGADG